MADTTPEPADPAHASTQVYRDAADPPTVLQTGEQLALAAASTSGREAVPGYEILGETRPRRHGRRLQGPADRG